MLEVTEWIPGNLPIRQCDTTEYMYSDMESQADFSLTVIHRLFDIARDWGDEGQIVGITAQPCETWMKQIACTESGSERLRLLIKEHMEHYHLERNHQGLDSSIIHEAEKAGMSGWNPSLTSPLQIKIPHPLFHPIMRAGGLYAAEEK